MLTSPPGPRLRASAAARSAAVAPGVAVDHVAAWTILQTAGVGPPSMPPPPASVRRRCDGADGDGSPSTRCDLGAILQRFVQPVVLQGFTTVTEPQREASARTDGCDRRCRRIAVDGAPVCGANGATLPLPAWDCLAAPSPPRAARSTSDTSSPARGSPAAHPGLCHQPHNRPPVATVAGTALPRTRFDQQAQFVVGRRPR